MSVQSVPASPGAPNSRRNLRFTSIVLATILGWNLLAEAVVWGVVAIMLAAFPARSGEDLGGGLAGLFFIVGMSGAVILSAVIGVVVVVVDPARRVPTTRTATAVGTRTAAWGLCAILPALVPLLIMLYLGA